MSPQKSNLLDRFEAKRNYYNSSTVLGKKDAAKFPFFTPGRRETQRKTSEQGNCLQEEKHENQSDKERNKSMPLGVVKNLSVSLLVLPFHSATFLCLSNVRKGKQSNDAKHFSHSITRRRWRKTIKPRRGSRRTYVREN